MSNKKDNTVKIPKGLLFEYERIFGTIKTFHGISGDGQYSLTENMARLAELTQPIRERIEIHAKAAAAKDHDKRAERFNILNAKTPHVAGEAGETVRTEEEEKEFGQLTIYAREYDMRVKEYEQKLMSETITPIEFERIGITDFKAMIANNTGRLKTETEPEIQGILPVGVGILRDLLLDKTIK